VETRITTEGSVPAKQFIYFVEGATDSVDDFDAQGVSFVPLAGGPGDCDPKVSCYHLAPGAQIAEIPCFSDIALLVVHGRLTAKGDWWADCGIEMSGGMGLVLGAGEALRVESDEGAILIVVEAPRLIATSRGYSSPERIMGQCWPGERPPRKTLSSMIDSVRFRIRWWRLWLPRVLAPRRTERGQSPRVSR
jgi:hypothetical protein